MIWSSSPGGLNMPDVAAWVQQGLFKAVITWQASNSGDAPCLSSSGEVTEIREGSEWVEEEKGVCYPEP